VFKPKLCRTSFDRFDAKVFQPAHDRLENLFRRESDSKYNLAKQLRANSLRAVIFSSERCGFALVSGQPPRADCCVALAVEGGYNPANVEIPT
jgi:hypothetical protein